MLQHPSSSKADTHGLDRLHHSVDDVRRLLKHVGPNEVHQMLQRIFTAQPSHPQCHVLHHSAGSLPMNQITVHQCVLKQRGHRIHVVLAHFADVLEEEGQCLEHTVLDVQFRQPVFVEERRKNSEWTAGFRHDGNSNSCAYPVLPFLYLKIVEEHCKHVLGTNSLGNVSKSVHGGPTNGLFVCLKHIEQFKTNAHPLLGRNKLGTTISNTPDQVDAILLHLLVTISQNWR
mmetsp:Transcript_36314/g.56744  ORF Transcript_36314/g.56744 Transcript_36314/m.56744 type:complete len:230 (-) Transcript_36314:236-925(-)